MIARSRRIVNRTTNTHPLNVLGMNNSPQYARRPYMKNAVYQQQPQSVVVVVVVEVCARARMHHIKTIGNSSTNCLPACVRVLCVGVRNMIRRDCKSATAASAKHESPSTNQGGGGGCRFELNRVVRTREIQSPYWLMLAHFERTNDETFILRVIAKFTRFFQWALHAYCRRIYSNVSLCNEQTLRVLTMQVFGLFQNARMEKDNTMY